MNRSQKLLLLLIISILSSPVSAQVSLPKLISDGMVLQRDHELKLWGWTSPGEDVALTFKGRTITATTGRDGNWEIRIPAQNAGGPYKMVFDASNKISVENILFGDVWVSSDQSNMELTMTSNRRTGILMKAAGKVPILKAYWDFLRSLTFLPGIFMNNTACRSESLMQLWEAHRLKPG